MCVVKGFLHIQSFKFGLTRVHPISRYGLNHTWLRGSTVDVHSTTTAIVYKHWPDTREFITRTVDLWKRWIRLSCYYNI